MDHLRIKAPRFAYVFLIFLTLSWGLQNAYGQQKNPIRTVVVLVLENRSFDHLLGWMKKSVNPRINGVTGKECNPVSTKAQDTETVCFTDDAQYVDPDPGHSFEDVEQQVLFKCVTVSFKSLSLCSHSLSHRIGVATCCEG